MPIYTKNGKRILFVHIPKTGGSSIEKYLRSHDWEESRRFGHGIKNIHATWREYEKWGNFNYKFTVVRDPVERFKSDLAHLTRDRKHAKEIRNFFAKPVKIQLNPHDNEPVEWAISDQNLRRFLAEVKKHPECFDNHIRPQVDFLNTNEEIDIFRYPNLSPEIKMALNFVLDVPLTGAKIAHLKNFPQEYKPTFTKSQEEIIKQYYKKDYKRFF